MKRAVTLLVIVILGCSFYSNLAFVVSETDDFRYFPPFKAGYNGNSNRRLAGGAEYLNIAKSLVAGKGFANPFAGGETGPTAWMPPVLPVLLAGLLILFAGNVDAVMAVLVVTQAFVLIGTGLLVLAMTRRTTVAVGVGTACTVFLIAVLCDYRRWFQSNHDCWLVLLGVDALLAGAIWTERLRDAKRSAAWGLLGGFTPMINPILGVCWLFLSVCLISRGECRSRNCALALVCAVLTLSPWCARNYLVFGRFVPIKSNLAYELYQSQCLQEDGVLQAFFKHPIEPRVSERVDYDAMGEIGYNDNRMSQFLESVKADPLEFADRVASRFLAVTLWYMPQDRADVERRPWATWATRLVYPLPFLSLLLLSFSTAVRGLNWAQVCVMGVYSVYFAPYIVISYFDRYAMPMIGVKALLVVWGADRVYQILNEWREGWPSKHQ